MNYHRLHVTMQEHRRIRWRNANDLLEKEKEKEVLDSLKKDCELHQQRLEKYSDIADKVQAKMTALVWEIDSLYKKEVFTSVETFIRRTIQEQSSSKNLILHEYDTKTDAELLKIQNGLRKDIDAKIKSLSVKLDEALKEFQICFKIDSRSKLLPRAPNWGEIAIFSQLY